MAEAPASAITAELAKKCRALAIKAHPWKRPGEKGGTAQVQRDYFSECLAKGGDMPAQPSGPGQSENGQPPGSIAPK